MTNYGTQDFFENTHTRHTHKVDENLVANPTGSNPLMSSDFDPSEIMGVYQFPISQLQMEQDTGTRNLSVYFP